MAVEERHTEIPEPRSCLDRERTLFSPPLEAVLLPDGSLTLYDWSGAQLLDELAPILAVYGLGLDAVFRSPCG